MSLLIMLGNALRRDRFWLSLPVAETILRALVVYLLTLIERGRIRQDGLAKELLTESELLTVASRAKGFSSLEDIESRELEPGGGFFQQPAELRRRT